MHAPAAGEDVRERAAELMAYFDHYHEGNGWRDRPRDAHGGLYIRRDRVWAIYDLLTALLRAPRGEGKAVRLLGLAMERAELLCRDAGRAEWPPSDFGRDMLQARLDTVRDLIGDALAALRSEAPGEASGLAECIITCMGCGQDFDANDDVQARYHEAACEVVDYEPARVEIARRLRGAALRSEAQGEDRWEDVVFGPITEAYHEAHAARRGEGGGE
ncbi:MAG TPA: hypothetical protein VIK91_19390 [Nannocystis sp.]